MLEQIERWDRRLFLLLNELHTPFLDEVMWHISGKLEWIPLYLVLLFFAIKKYGKAVWKVLLGTIAVVLLTDQLSVHLFKEIFERYRPCHNLEISQLVHSVNNKCGGKFGFISSHAANSFGIATYLGFLLSKPKNYLVLYLLLIWAVIVSYSRIYLGVHYPADVLCGGILGFLIGYFIYKLTLRAFKLN